MPIANTAGGVEHLVKVWQQSIAEMQREHQGGLFVNEGMMLREFAVRLGVVPKPDLTRAIYTQVAMQHCPFELSWAACPETVACQTAQALKPEGMVFVERTPLQVIRFSLVTDMIKYRLTLPPHLRDLP